MSVEVLHRYLVSQDYVVPPKALLTTLAKRFPQYKFETGNDMESKKVIDNSKVCVDAGRSCVCSVCRNQSLEEATPQQRQKKSKVNVVRRFNHAMRHD